MADFELRPIQLSPAQIEASDRLLQMSDEEAAMLPPGTIYRLRLPNPWRSITCSQRPHSPEATLRALQTPLSPDVDLVEAPTPPWLIPGQ